MKRLTSIICFLFLVAILNVQAKDIIIKKNEYGKTTYVKFIKGSTTTAEEFFDSYLHVKGTDEFRETPTNNFIPNVRFERYQQYYKGLKVDGAHYTFEYKDGMMLKAHGNYVPVEDLNIIPKLTGDDVKNIYAANLDININDTIYSSAELLIKEIPEKEWTGLVYRVYLATPSLLTADVAYIDAQTGETLCKEISSFSYSATGYFITYYNGTKTGITEWQNNINKYRLYDSTRGYGIHTQYCNGTGNMDITNDFYIWSGAEVPFLNGEMALDVHWTMEQIYDALMNSYGQNSYDGSGGIIQSSCHTSYDIGTQYHNYFNRFFFYNSNNSQSGPEASVDIVGHEFGHSILYRTTQWTPNSNEKMAMHEGFADVWGIIFEDKITPNADIWKTGEDVWNGIYSCERNFAYPSDPNARTHISSTYSIMAINNTDPHLSGGIAPRWFYLLVNGGSGTNNNGQPYSILPATMYDAQLLVAYSFLHPCLEDCTTFSDVREVMIDVSLDYMNSTVLAGKVASAWYAVGVGNSPSYAPQHDMETGMTSIGAKPQTEGKDVIYNLNGQQLQSKPTKGVYIQNGKKYVVK